MAANRRVGGVDPAALATLCVLAALSLVLRKDKTLGGAAMVATLLATMVGSLTTPTPSSWSSSGTRTLRNYFLFRYRVLRPIFYFIWFRQKWGKPVIVENRPGADGHRQVRIHAIGFPLDPSFPPVTQTRFSTLMRIISERNGGAFVGLNQEPGVPTR